MRPESDALAVRSVLRCRGCGREVAAAEPYPFRCPDAGGDDVDHLLRRQLDPEVGGGTGALFAENEENPFIRFRGLLHSYQLARVNGLSDADWTAAVERLDLAVASVAGYGFRTTPFNAVPDIARRLGVSVMWVKNESGNVSGSHKGRHLMGVMLWLEAVQWLGLIDSDASPSLAIASCGNAALAAAIVARAAGRRLEVFVPTHANPQVLEQLTSFGAHLHPCPRQRGEAGDPCYLRFREALTDGALPFTCQGNENGLTLDGGKTIAWEMVSSLRSKGGVLDRLFLHVGGGALASSVIEGWREAVALNVAARLPRIHAVQTAGAHPLARAYRLLSARILDRWASATGGSVPDGKAERAELMASSPLERFVAEALDYAVTHRSEFMWPWEEEPRSIADGILDDETYDWFAVLEGMLETGGWPVVVSEASLREANQLARQTTELRPCHTGTAGLAGAIELARDSGLAKEEAVAVIVSGMERSN